MCDDCDTTCPDWWLDYMARYIEDEELRRQEKASTAFLNSLERKRRAPSGLPASPAQYQELQRRKLWQKEPS
jgi:hypothetical protein